MEVSPDRRDIALAAVDFLQNAEIIRKPLRDKMKFLQEKGLSEIEIDQAINLVMASKQQVTSSSGKWNILLMMGICYGGFHLYKLYSEYLSSKQEVKAKGTDQIKEQHMSLTEILSKVNELQRLIEAHRCDFKAEIRSIRSLMLGHEKFTSPPTIPSWQLSDEASIDEDGIQEDSPVSKEIPICPIPS